MAERSGRAEGKPWVTPYLAVRDVVAELAFHPTSIEGYAKDLARRFGEPAKIG